MSLVNRSTLEPVEDETKCFPTEQNQASTCTAKLPPSLPSSVNYICLVPVPRAKMGQGKLSISHGPDSPQCMTVVHWRGTVAITLHLPGRRGHQAKPPVTPCDSAHEVSVQTPCPCRTASAHGRGLVGWQCSRKDQTNPTAVTMVILLRAVRCQPPGVSGSTSSYSSACSPRSGCCGSRDCHFSSTAWFHLACKGRGLRGTCTGA